jgi:hypothetical protein
LRATNKGGRRGEGEEKRGDLLEGINNGVRRYGTGAGVRCAGSCDVVDRLLLSKEFQFLREIDHGGHGAERKRRYDLMIRGRLVHALLAQVRLCLEL